MGTRTNEDDIIFANNPSVSPTIFNPTGTLRPDFEWSKPGIKGNSKGFSLVEIKPGTGKIVLSDELKKLSGATPLIETAVEGNKLSYPKDAPALTKGSYYVWVVYETDAKEKTMVLDAGLFKAGAGTTAKAFNNCTDCEKDCKIGRCWDINGKCYCF